jgi:hypothetical protein
MSLLDPTNPLRLWILGGAATAIFAAGAAGGFGVERVLRTAEVATVKETSAVRESVQAGAALKDQQTQIATGAERQETKDAAVQNGAQRQAVLRTDAAAVRAGSDQLRRANAAAATASLVGSVCADQLAASRQHAAAVDAVLADMEPAAAQMAIDANGHASDSLMFQQAWPKR